MKRFAWLLGLFHTLCIFLFVGLAISMLMVKWTWLDMRTSAGGIILVAILFSGIFYALNSVVKLSTNEPRQKRKVENIVILGSYFVILVSNFFSWDSLRILPAATVRQGLYLDSMSLSQINYLLIFLAVVTFGLHWLIYHRKGRQVSEDSRKELSRKESFNVWLVLGISFLFFTLYFTLPGVQYALYDVSAKLIQADIEVFRDYLLSFGVWAPIISTLMMILCLIVAPLPAFVVTFTNGLLFGAFWGGLLSWSSAMLGAAICFYISRSLGRPAVEKLVTKTALEWTDRFFDRYGMHSVLIARLVPIISFALVSYAAGLTSIRFWTFFIATGIGQAPATIIYSYLGQNANKSVMIIFWMFVVVICFSIIGMAVKPVLEKRMRKGDSGDGNNSKIQRPQGAKLD